VAKGKKTGGRNFPPGQSGNPKGPIPLPEDIKAARKLTPIEFERAVNKFLFWDRDALKEAVKDPKTAALDAWVITIILRATAKGDERPMSFLLERLIGKVKERIEHTAGEGEPLVILTMPRNGREAPREVETSPAKKKEPGHGSS
jgi:hypothetical protein